MGKQPWLNANSDEVILKGLTVPIPTHSEIGRFCEDSESGSRSSKYAKTLLTKYFNRINRCDATASAKSKLTAPEGLCSR